MLFRLSPDIVAPLFIVVFISFFAGISFRNSHTHTHTHNKCDYGNGDDDDGIIVVSNVSVYHVATTPPAIRATAATIATKSQH